MVIKLFILQLWAVLFTCSYKIQNIFQMITNYYVWIRPNVTVTNIFPAIKNIAHCTYRTQMSIMLSPKYTFILPSDLFPSHDGDFCLRFELLSLCLRVKVFHRYILRWIMEYGVCVYGFFVFVCDFIFENSLSEGVFKWKIIIHIKHKIPPWRYD